MKSLSTLLGMVTGAIVTTLGVGSAAFAVDFSFRGTFSQDDDVHLFDFSVDALSPVLFRTYSYAGGTQADGTVIAPGGFDPILTLFDGDGNLIGENDDDIFDIVAEDPTTHQAYDSLLSVLLDAGNYTVSLTQYGNFASGPNLLDGFIQTGNGNYTSELSNCATESPFCDFMGDVRTNAWAFDAIGVLPLLEADEVEPSVVELPVVEPPVEPPVVEPPVVEPPVSEPPVEPPVSELSTEPPVVEPPVVEPPVNEPPVSEPPVIDPGSSPTQVPEPTTVVAFSLVGLGALAQRYRKK
ncbi:MAG: DVUA0089 family protein [Cyanobacteria bacterium P01_F01_bin.13]